MITSDGRGMHADSIAISRTIPGSPREEMTNMTKPARALRMFVTKAPASRVRGEAEGARGDRPYSFFPPMMRTSLASGFVMAALLRSWFPVCADSTAPTGKGKGNGGARINNDRSSPASAVHWNGRGRSPRERTSPMIRDPVVLLQNLVLSLSDALDLVHLVAVDHQQRVAYMALRLALQAEWPPGERAELLSAAALHDIGILSVEERAGISAGALEHRRAGAHERARRRPSGHSFRRAAGI